MMEMIVDSFAGGGGASQGIFEALGRHPDIAINHDAAALAMHRANHPETLHVSKNIYKVDPLDYVGRRPVGLLWASPDCKHFSKAKGGRPVKRNIRDLAWTVVLWARRARPRVILLENVEEFRTWGPVIPDDNGGHRPCPERVGQTFDDWVKALKRLGYKVQWRELRACDYGAPTIRKRLFVIARRDGKPIVWPEPTHGAPDDPDVIAGKKLRWRTAADIIDWSLPCPSIFDTSAEIKALYGLRAKRPLVDATLRRIAKGVVRYVLEAKKPFVVSVAHGDSGGRREYPIDEPLGTMTSGGNAHAVISPVVTYAQQGGGNRAADAPLHTVCASAKDQNSVIVPTLIQTGYGERKGQAPRVPGLEKPIGTQVAGAAKHALVVPTLVGCGGRAGQSPPRGGDQPMGTLTAKPDGCLVAAHLSRFTQNGIGQSATEPLDTVMPGAPKFGVVAAFLAQHNGGPRPGQPAHGADEPVSTITAAGSHQGVIAAHMMALRGSTRRAFGADEPVRTESAGGNHNAVAACILQQFGRSVGSAADDPVGTVTTRDKAALVSAFLTTYYGNDQGWSVDRPYPTDTTRDRCALVTVEIDGQTFVIVDIGMRMLTPRERFLAQGFPEDYRIETGVGDDGGPLPLTMAEQGRMCGNSVCPPLARALVAANVPELAVEQGEVAA